MRISDWSSDVCSSDLDGQLPGRLAGLRERLDSCDPPGPHVDGEDPVGADVVLLGEGVERVGQPVRVDRVRRPRYWPGIRITAEVGAFHLRTAPWAGYHVH